jgi:hypothetical protein
MVRTLRITTIIAALLAGGGLIFSAVFGARADKTVEEFLKSPAAIERFQQAKGQKKAEGESQTSPLVKQAQAFALYLNPPPPPEPIMPSRSQPPQPKVTTPTFKLIGTSFYPLHPDLSLALIDEPGKGIYWVRQSGHVGHLVIEQIKDGVVVVSDGGRTFEVVMAAKPKRVSLVKSSAIDETNTKSAPPSGEAKTVSPPAPAKAVIVSPTPVEGKAEQVAAEPNAMLGAEEVAALEGLVRNLRTAEANAGLAEEDKKANDELEKFVESIKVSTEEAQKLDQLGKDLQSGGAEANLVGRNAKIER